MVVRSGPRVTCFALYWPAGQLVQSLVQPLVQPSSQSLLSALQHASSQKHPVEYQHVAPSAKSHEQLLAPLAHVDPESLRARRRAINSAQGGRGKAVATWS